MYLANSSKKVNPTEWHHHFIGCEKDINKTREKERTNIKTTTTFPKKTKASKEFSSFDYYFITKSIHQPITQSRHEKIPRRRQHYHDTALLFTRPSYLWDQSRYLHTIIFHHDFFHRRLGRRVGLDGTYALDLSWDIVVEPCRTTSRGPNFSLCLCPTSGCLFPYSSRASIHFDGTIVRLFVGVLAGND